LNRSEKHTGSDGIAEGSAKGDPATSRTISALGRQWRDPQKRAAFESELQELIEDDRRAKKYLDSLAALGLQRQYVISALIRDACGYEVPPGLGSEPDEESYLREFGSATLPRRARHLAKEIEVAESNTPNVGIDELNLPSLKSENERRQAVEDLRKLPESLRLYADYFEKSRTLWRALGRVTRKAREHLEKAVRDSLQIQAYRLTGKHSDLRYSHLVNLAREAVGKAPLDEKVLAMRRLRRLAKQRTHKP